MATAEAVATSIAALSAAYRREFDKATVLTWGRALRDLDDEVLGQAVDAWINNSPRLATPAEIRETARIILARRRMNQRALTEHRPSPEDQLSSNRRGMAMVRHQMAQGKLLVGQKVDDVLKEEA